VLKINFSGGKQVAKIESRQIIDANSDPAISKIPVTNIKARTSEPVKLPKYHWVRGKKDSRDYTYKPAKLDSVPAVTDLRQWCSAIDDQGQLGSCTGQGTAGCIEYMDRRYHNKQTEISRLFIYYYERLIEGTVNSDSGAQIRDAIKATSTYGAPLESLWPYNISKFKMPPATAAVQDAANRKVTLYENIPNGDYQSCINAIAAGYPVIIGFDVYSSFESQTVAQTGIMPYPNVKSEKLLGGHCVLLVGYDNTKNTFIVRNSWGTSWGDKGYFYMPYEVIQNTQLSSDFWVIKSVNDPN